MAAVQRLRASAQANGRLTSTAQQTVSTDTQSGQPAIVIQPANPDVIYVPVYDPAYVWGPPVVGYYPPLFYPAFGFGWGSGINLGLCFSSWGGWGGWGWGRTGSAVPWWSTTTSSTAMDSVAVPASTVQIGSTIQTIALGFLIPTGRLRDVSRAIRP